MAVQKLRVWVVASWTKKLQPKSANCSNNLVLIRLAPSSMRLHPCLSTQEYTPASSAECIIFCLSYCFGELGFASFFVGVAWSSVHIHLSLPSSLCDSSRVLKRVHKLVQLTGISCCELKGMPSLLIAVLEPRCGEICDLPSPFAFNILLIATFFIQTGLQVPRPGSRSLASSQLCSQTGTL